MPLVLAFMLFFQGYSQRGFVEGRGTVYPQEAANDSGHTVGELLFRYESSYSPRQDLQFSGSVDLRTDTHHQTDRRWRVDWADRRLQRPAFSIRRLSAQWYRGGFNIEAGKQVVRWGKTDIIN